MIKMKLTGDIRKLKRDLSLSKVNSTLELIDDEIGDITQAMVAKQSRLAPVDTGLLRDTIAGSANHAGLMHWQALANLDIVPYYWRQNFEHVRKRYYITKPFNEVELIFEERLQKVVDRAW